MNILRNSLKASLIGFVSMGLTELVGLLPALYCLKGIIQPLVWLCIGWLAGFFISQKGMPLKWNIVIPASLLAGFITGLSSILTQFALQVYLVHISKIRVGDTMFPPGLDPISETWWGSLLTAILLSVVGGAITVAIAKHPKTITATKNADSAKKVSFAWTGSLVSAVIGALVLTGIITLLYKEFASLGNLSTWTNYEFISYIWPYTVIIGIVTGVIIYTGIYLLRTSDTVPRRIFSILILAIGGITGVAAFLALALFILTLDMM